MPTKRRKGKQYGTQSVGRQTPVPSSPPRSFENAPRIRLASSPSKEPPMVLTSDKRRGIYECDYCHTDISQVPRIRCAVCPDFDLCLDCFATTDHSIAASRIRAASAAHGAVQQQQQQLEGHIPGISKSAMNHSADHRYRVADSTRYPLFASTRMISRESSSFGGFESMDIDDFDDSAEGMNQDESKQELSNEGSKDNTNDDVVLEQLKETKTYSINDSTHGSLVTNDSEVSFVVQDDPKTVWTIEEDLRLLDAISVCGLGNWTDIAEAIGGQGSSCKTPKRCMERYFDDFLGRYGHILPPYTIVEDEEEQDIGGEEDRSVAGGENEHKKRRLERMSSLGLSSALPAGRRGKKLKVVPTPSLPDYDKVWPDPYIPPISEAKAGQEVGRHRRYRAEQVFVKLITNAASAEEAEGIRTLWKETRLNQPDGPTVLPIRLDDLPSLPGSELAGFMPRRGDFDMEWDNDAENILADMEFTTSDSAQDRELKIKVIQIYNTKLDERERRKNFLLSRGLLDYRKNQQEDAKLPRDERDLLRRMRLFERLHTPEEHKLFIADILRAKRLRKEIAQLQLYRRMGIKTLAEAEKYENDKACRQIHTMSYLQKEAETGKVEVVKSRSSKDDGVGHSNDEDEVTSSLWKQYRTSDRKNRRSVNRSALNASTSGSVKTNLMEVYKGGGQGLNQHPSNEASSTTPHPPNADSANDETKTQDSSTSALASNANPSPEEATESIEQYREAVSTREDSSRSEELRCKDKADSDKSELAGGKEGDCGFSISGMSGYDLLTHKEAELCRRVQLKPRQYLKAKKAIILESFRAGLLDKEGNPNHTLVTIDVHKKGEVVDFMVRAGWISPKV